MKVNLASVGIVTGVLSLSLCLGAQAASSLIGNVNTQVSNQESIEQLHTLQGQQKQVLIAQRRGGGGGGNRPPNRPPSPPPRDDWGYRGRGMRRISFLRRECYGYGSRPACRRLCYMEGGRACQVMRRHHYY